MAAEQNLRAPCKQQRVQGAPVTSRNGGRLSEEPRKEADLGGRGDEKARHRLVFLDQRTGMIE